jgi:hypothetical protein
MKKYSITVIVIALFSSLVLNSCKKEKVDTFELVGTKWIGEDLFNLYANRYDNGKITRVLSLNAPGTGTLKTIDNYKSASTVSITDESLTWTLNGNEFNVSVGGKVLKGDLSYTNQNVNFLREDNSYIAFDKIDLLNLATKVFRGTFLQIGTTVPKDVTWIFLSGSGFKMVFPNNSYVLYPLSKYEIDNAGKLLVHYFAGRASGSVPIDLTNHGGQYTPANDSIVYNTSNIPSVITYNGSENWRGIYRLKELK